MRIAQLCPPWERVPPPAYGGIELVVGLLTDELVRRGHDVSLFATGDSISLARVCSVCERPLREIGLDFPVFTELAHVGAMLEVADQFDVIHNHCGEMAMPFAPLVQTPMLTTVHGPMRRERELVWSNYSGFYATISASGKEGFPDRGYLGVVYNGIDFETFPFTPNKNDYLLFLSRISYEKGTHIAIEAARAVQRRLIIAGKVDRADREYFRDQIEPQIDGHLIEYVGEANASFKRQLFAQARCLLHPVTWPEPFGLVMVEAMACGTPVVGMRNGSVPEVVAHGETGFVADSFDEFIDGIKHVHEIDPHRCRKRVQDLFNVPRMADGYLAAYERCIHPD